MKEQLIKEFNNLGVSDMEEVTELHEGKGDYPFASVLMYIVLNNQVSES